MSFAVGFEPPAAGSGASLKNLEKQLICPVCLEVFSKPVVILPCQHNLCRKCANDILQQANPSWHSRTPSSTVGSRFRCPSCRHEVVLDRHGVYGLQRNLLVENIIDIYRSQESSRLGGVKPEKTHQQHVMCEEHPEEKVNIYCLSCQTPTCSLCKVFGQHRDCDVAPLDSVYERQKAELSDTIAALVASNDQIQSVISHMEAVCRTIEESGQQRQQQLGAQFSALLRLLDDRKQQLVSQISDQQDDKLRRVRSLVRRHADQLEAGVLLVETALRTMEEPHMPVFIQNASAVLEKMAAAAARSSSAERPDAGFQSLSHFAIDTDAAAQRLRSMDFCCDDDEEDEEDEEESSL
ncbi:tripartite motif-containing protein 54 [Neosynchiropus ocellatus]